MKILEKSFLLLKEELEEVIKVKKISFTPEDDRVFSFLLNYLNTLITECNSGKLKPRSHRFNHIGTIVVDIPTALLDPELGGRLIKAEVAYINY